MANLKILGKNTSGISQFADTDVALVPQTVQPNSGQLTVQSQSATPVILGTGAQIPASQTLNTAGSGNINLPNNASARFQVESVSVSANVTAANLNTLTAGSASNADALHTHTSVQASNLDITGLTLWAVPIAGEVGYISANNTAAKAKADVFSTSGVVGVYAGTAGTLLAIAGKVSLYFDTGLTLAAGDRVWLSDATSGRVTNVEPTTATRVSYELGRLLDTTGYSTITGTALPVLAAPKTPIIL